MGKHHDKEFKIQVAKLVVEEGKKPGDLAKELNISYPTLSKWVAAYKDKKDEGFVGSGNIPPELQSNKELAKRIKDLEEENAILKKAMHIFTKSPK
nr:transposase [Peribacillus alkalitolerans]